MSIEPDPFNSEAFHNTIYPVMTRSTEKQNVLCFSDQGTAGPEISEVILFNRKHSFYVHLCIRVSESQQLVDHVAVRGSQLRMVPSVCAISDSLLATFCSQ